jgi:hypothetical protein
MIYLSPYRSLSNEKIKTSFDERVLWRNKLGQREPFARIYWNQRRATYSYEYGDNTWTYIGPNVFIDVNYARHLLDITLKKIGCIFLTEERFLKLEALK